LTATVRRKVVVAVLDHWQKAAELRQSGSKEQSPPRRPTTRPPSILTRLYNRHNRARPRFAWVESPRQGLALATGIPDHEDLQRWLRPRPPVHYDILRCLGLAHYPAPQAAGLDAWATLARTTGWWWPGEQVCVMVDRPARIDPVALRDDALPVRAEPAVVYRDGWRPR
jgi:hypothetical protein